MGANALHSLKNDDYSDRELLHILRDQGDDEGWSTTYDLVDVLGIKAPQNGHEPTKEEHAAHAVRCVGTRFSWMVRYGFCERDEDKTGWRLTPEGNDLIDGKMTRQLRERLDRMKPGDRVLLMREIAGAYTGLSDAARAMVRREWQRGTGRKRG